MKVETDLAKASMDRVERRDPNKVYHKMTVAQLQKLSPAFAWNEYFAAVETPKFDSLDVSVPDFVKGMNQVIARPASGRHQDLSALADLARRGSDAADGLCRRELRLLRQDPDAAPRSCGRAGSAACSSPTAIWAKRWARPMSPKTFPPESKAATLQDGA